MYKEDYDERLRLFTIGLIGLILISLCTWVNGGYAQANDANDTSN